MLLAPILWRGGPPEFLDLHYKAHPDCDHVAKFHGDRPRELEVSPAKGIKQKNISSKTRPSGTAVPSGPRFCMLLAPNFVEGRTPRIFGLAL